MTDGRLWMVEGEFHPLLLEEANRGAATSMYWWADGGLTVRAVRGRKMRERAGLFDEFAGALQFPLYFGENEDAFDECIRELDDSLPFGRGYVIVILDPDQLLADEIDEKFAWVARSLKNACENLARPIELGGSYDRPAVPFHVVLAGDQATLSRAARRWAHFGFMPASIEGRRSGRGGSEDSTT